MYFSRKTAADFQRLTKFVKIGIQSESASFIKLQKRPAITTKQYVIPQKPKAFRVVIILAKNVRCKKSKHKHLFPVEKNGTQKKSALNFTKNAPNRTNLSRLLWFFSTFDPITGLQHDQDRHICKK